MGGRIYPDGQPPPLDERWPGVARAGSGQLHLDPASLRRALAPLVCKLDELAGAGKGGLRDIEGRAAKARGAGSWGGWMTAERIGGFHGSALGQYLASYRELVAQAARVVEVVGRNVRSTTGADAGAGQVIADIQARVAGIAVPQAVGAGIAPVGSDGSFD